MNDNERVTPSCGCIFCDIGLSPVDGKHEVWSAGAIVECRKRNDRAVRDFTRVCKQQGLDLDYGREEK